MLEKKKKKKNNNLMLSLLKTSERKKKKQEQKINTYQEELRNARTNLLQKEVGLRQILDKQAQNKSVLQI